MGWLPSSMFKSERSLLHKPVRLSSGAVESDHLGWMARTSALDLVDMLLLTKSNGGIAFLLTMIEMSHNGPGEAH